MSHKKGEETGVMEFQFDSETASPFAAVPRKRPDFPARPEPEQTRCVAGG